LILLYVSILAGTNGATLPNDVCLNVSPTASGGEALELWAKPQPHGAWAVLLVNSHQTNTYTDVMIDPAELGLKGDGKLNVRDIWARKDSCKYSSTLPLLVVDGSISERLLVATAPLSAGGKLKLTVKPRDSQFVLLTPASSQ
jgi:hypothetical protein